MTLNETPPQPWFVLHAIDVGADDGVELLRGIELGINMGEFHVLTGRQGGGKSVFCRFLRGELPARAGRIIVDGKNIPRYTGAIARRLGVEALGSQPFVFPHLTVTDNIAVNLFRFPSCYWLGRRLVKKVESWLAENDIKDLPLDCPLGKLPLHEHLFVQTLTSLFNRPRLLVLDETLENLPTERREQVMTMLRRFMADGLSVLWATHQLEDGWRLADRITIMRHGKVLLTDFPGNIDRRSLLRLAYAQFPDAKEDDRERERFANLIIYTEALLKDLPLAIVIADNHGIVQFINQAGRDLFPACQPDGLEPATLFSMLDSRNHWLLKIVSRVLEGEGRIGENAVSFTGPEGELTVDCQVQPVRDGFVIIGAMLIIQDVSERERFRNRLILSHNVSSVGLLAAGVAHDVNNPLSVIGNYLSYLLRNLPEGNIRDAAGKIGKETQNIQKIIDNLVAFSDYVRDDLDSVNLHALAVDLCTLLRFDAEAFGIKLLVIPPENENQADLIADIKEMRQLLLNLIRNAMEAQPDGGFVKVDFSKSTADGIRIEVSDNGPGIKLERLADVFEPFVSTKSDDDRYHGIGLTIVYSLVEKYGGDIEVENIVEGGCRFSLFFKNTSQAKKEPGAQIA